MLDIAGESGNLVVERQNGIVPVLEGLCQAKNFGLGTEKRQGSELWKAIQGARYSRWGWNPGHKVGVRLST